MATHQMDSLVLPCDGAAEPDAQSETIRGSFQTGETLAEAVHSANLAASECLDEHDATGTANESEAASLTSSIADQWDAASNDLADLYSCFSAYCEEAHYHELVQEEDARRAGCRWPLLVESGGVRAWVDEKGQSC